MKIMKTIIEKIDKNQKNTDIIREAGRILKEGGLVAFPTETVYGLGADALNEDAAKKIYAAKGRPSDNPLIIHITNMKALDKIVSEVPEKAVKVAEKYWPGPLTMIFNKSDIVPYGTTGGLDTVAVRMPVDEIAREVIDAYNNRTNALSDERLVSLNKNYFGFYCKYANEVYNSLVDLSSYSDIIGTKEYDKLMSDLSICKSILDACSDHVKRM